MSQIEIRCVDQTAMFTNLPEIFSGDVNIDTVKFTFDDSWNGYTTKTAVFYNNPKDVYPQILDNNNIAVIPSQVMTKECKLSIGVFGTKANGDVKPNMVEKFNADPNIPNDVKSKCLKTKVTKKTVLFDTIDKAMLSSEEQEAIKSILPSSKDGE